MALKPQGSTVTHLAQLARTFARAGIDVVKDDHGLANQPSAPFAARVPAVQQAIDEANRESGGRTLYAPTLSGHPRALAEQLRVARDCGIRLALVAPMLVGLPVFVELRRESGLALLAHPAFGGATRIAPALLLGKLFRVFGADATIFPNHGGRFSYGRDTCLAIARAARDPWEGLAPAMPVPAGGMSVERVPEMVADYGRDTMLLIGGGLLSADCRRETAAQIGIENLHRHALRDIRAGAVEMIRRLPQRLAGQRRDFTRHAQNRGRARDVGQNRNVQHNITQIIGGRHPDRRSVVKNDEPSCSSLSPISFSEHTIESLFTPRNLAGFKVIFTLPA